MVKYAGMIFFLSYLTDFSYFPLINIFQELQDTDRTDKKKDLLKVGVDGFSSFQSFYFPTRIIPEFYIKV
jgi:hypothetical protein